jgi:cysteine desulfurase/selenocysteine lyase
MIEDVTMTTATWAESPKRFEAGVPNMAQAVGLGAALEYLNSVGLSNISNHERLLTSDLLEQLSGIKEVRVVGPTDMENRGSSVSFTIDEIHPHDVGQYLDSLGIAVRTGHHCAWPLTRKLGVAATTRASMYLYNTEEDIAELVSGVRGAMKYFGSK